MSHPAKKLKVDSEDIIDAKGAPAEAAPAEEHEGGGEEREHAEEEEVYETLDEGLKEELDSAVAALEEVQEKIRGVGLHLRPHDEAGISACPKFISFRKACLGPPVIGTAT